MRISDWSSDVCSSDLDQYAGASADEVADPRPWAELLRQATTFHLEFSYLPRKFKFAVTAANEDRAAIRLHDISLKLVRNDTGELGLEVFIGGGMGRTDRKSTCLNSRHQYASCIQSLALNKT